MEQKDNRELVVTRILNAPRELVFKVWTEPEHIAKWWGPDGFTNTIEKMDVRPGGEWILVMHGPDGTNFPNKSVFVEVVKPERIVFRHIRPDFQATITFQEIGNKTELTWKMVFDSPEELQQVIKAFKADEGLRQNVEKLQNYLDNLPAENNLTITRVFNAPRELVYKVWTEPEHMAKWWGPKGCQVSVVKLDLKPGGLFHYSMSIPGGGEMWGRFVYHEIVAPARLVFVNSFSDKDGNIARAPFSQTWPLEVMNTLTLTEDNGKTTLTLSGGPVNATDVELRTFRDMIGGMQQGFAGTFDQLDEYLSAINK